MASPIQVAHETLSEIRERFHERFISIGESTLEEYSQNSDDESQNQRRPTFLSRQSSHLQVPQQGLRAPSSSNSSGYDLTTKRFSKEWAIPPQLDLTSKSSLDLEAVETNPRPQPHFKQFYLDTIPQSPHAGANLENNIHLSRFNQPKVRPSFRRHISDGARRLSVTPGDIVYPPPALIHDRIYGRNKAAETLGLRRKGHIVDEEQVKEDERTLISPNGVSNFSEPPDGGTLAWAHAVAGFLVTFNCWGYNIAFGIFEAYYVFDMLKGNSPSKVAWIGSVQLFMLFFLGTPIGLAMDRGWFRIFFNGGTLLMILSIFLTSFCTQWWQLFLVQGLLTGVAVGMVFCSGTIVLMTYFKKHIGVAMALAAAGSSVGAIVYALTFQHLIAARGFPGTMRVLGAIALCTMLPPTLIVRPRPNARPTPHTLSFSALADLPYWLMCAGLFLAFWGLFLGFYYIVLYGQHRLHLSPAAAANLLAAMCAANIPGRLLPGLVSDRCIGPLNTLIPAAALSAMLLFLWVGVATHAALVVLACCYGFAVAGVQALYAPAIHGFALRDAEAVGLKAGTAFSVISVACLTGAPIGGRLIGMDGGEYLYAQVFAGSCLVGATVLLVSARVTRVGWGSVRA